MSVWLVVENLGYEHWYYIAAYTTKEAAEARAAAENAKHPGDPGDRFPNYVVSRYAIPVDPAEPAVE